MHVGSEMAVWVPNWWQLSNQALDITLPDRAFLDPACAARCETAEPIITEVNRTLGLTALTIETARIIASGEEHCHVQFPLGAHRSQQALKQRLKAVPLVTALASTAHSARD